MRIDWAKVKRRIFMSDTKRYGLKYKLWEKVYVGFTVFIMGLAAYTVFRYQHYTDHIPMLLGCALGLYGMWLSLLITMAVLVRRIKELGGDSIHELEKREKEAKNVSDKS